MSLNIKNPDVEAKIRKLAEIEGTSLTEAIDRAVEESLRKRDAHYDREVERFLEMLDALGPVPPGTTSNHDDLYDDDGMPL